MRTSADVLKKIVVENRLPYLNFSIYRPKGWREGTVKHFKEEKKAGQRRDPIGAVEHSPTEGIFNIRNEEILNDEIKKAVVRLPPDDVLQVFSATTDSQYYSSLHIPMLDIELPPSDLNLEYLVSCLRALGQERGAILLSGASYHYYGYLPLGELTWKDFMYRALLLDDVVDTRWVGHRLLDGFGVLRISKKEESGFIPYVVAEL